MFEVKQDEIKGYIDFPGSYCKNAHNNLIGLIADNGNHFLKYGIVEGTCCIFDTEKPYIEGVLSCFMKETVDDNTEFKLELKQPEGYSYIGSLVYTFMNRGM